MEEERLKDAAVIGAGGKMGKGIALLLLQLQAIAFTDFTLRLIDTDESALKKTLAYLKEELTRFAEKNINVLRKKYKDDPSLVSNGDMIEAFVSNSLANLQWGKPLELAESSSFIFEAIVEDVQVKTSLFKRLKNLSKVKPWFFTNTSSIPIHILAKEGEIEGALIGFHFYNPPAVQKLLELIEPKVCSSELATFARELAQKLGKDIVHSQDCAGFIGNGHFLREVCFAVKKGALTPKEIWQLNFITEKHLIRPMGIFRLVDYVGVDVVNRIAEVMSRYLNESMPLHFLQKCKSVFLYEKGEIVKVLDPSSMSYVPIDPQWEKELGALPTGWLPWKSMSSNQIGDYLQNLLSSKEPGAKEACEFLKHSYHIAVKLVDQKVADDLQDVDTVLKLGFYHRFGFLDLPVGVM